MEIQDLFAPNVTIGFACVDGQSVGIVANQPMNDAGTLDVDASEKAARFVRFCDAFGLPIVTFVDVPGYRPGTEQEQAGIIRRGAKVIVAYANATVPMVTVILRKATACYIVMGSKSIGADLAYAWPDAQIAVMGAEGAASIMYRRELAAARENGTFEETKAELVTRYEEETVQPPRFPCPPVSSTASLPPPIPDRPIIDSLHLLVSKDQRAPHVKRHDNGPL